MHRLVIFTVTALIAAAPAQAKSGSAAAMKWMDGPPGLPGGAKFAVLSGDPGKEGNFAVRIKMPANYAVPAHHHLTDEHVSVVSGRVSYGMSDKLDRAEAKTLGAGGKVVMKAGMNHWVFTKAPATLQVSGKGPFQITYVDPKDDPRGAQ
jgi:quercetin dioxygenase-like cupin family protein